MCLLRRTHGPRRNLRTHRHAKIVVLRTALAVAALAVLTRWLRIPLRIEPGPFRALAGTGALIGIHWGLFFSAVHVSNATVGVAGLPTTLVWTALWEWILFRRRPRGHLDSHRGARRFERGALKACHSTWGDD